MRHSRTRVLIVCALIAVPILATMLGMLSEKRSSDDIPSIFNNKQFTLTYSNGDRQVVAVYENTIIINNMPWMLLQVPVVPTADSPKPSNKKLLINPAQVRAIEGVP